MGRKCFINFSYYKIIARNGTLVMKIKICKASYNTESKQENNVNFSMFPLAWTITTWLLNWMTPGHHSRFKMIMIFTLADIWNGVIFTHGIPSQVGIVTHQALRTTVCMQQLSSISVIHLVANNIALCTHNCITTTRALCWEREPIKNNQYPNS